MSENTNTERAKFEAWMAQQDQADPEPGRTYELDEAGMNQLTEDCMWVAWQARASLSPPAAGQEPYCWTVSGGHSMFRGEYAKQDALSEAKQCGGTAIAFPLYTTPLLLQAVGWMPIETAPRDENYRDGSNAYSEYILAWYPGALAPLRVRWWQADSGINNFLADGGWAVFPTVWQPLPLPPAPSTEGESNANS